MVFASETSAFTRDSSCLRRWKNDRLSSDLKTGEKWVSTERSISFVYSLRSLLEKRHFERDSSKARFFELIIDERLSVRISWVFKYSISLSYTSEVFFGRIPRTNTHTHTIDPSSNPSLVTDGSCLDCFRRSWEIISVLASLDRLPIDWAEIHFEHRRTINATRCSWWMREQNCYSLNLVKRIVSIVIDDSIHCLDDQVRVCTAKEKTHVCLNASLVQIRMRLQRVVCVEGSKSAGVLESDDCCLESRSTYSYLRARLNERNASSPEECDRHVSTAVHCRSIARWHTFWTIEKVLVFPRRCSLPPTWTYSMVIGRSAWNFSHRLHNAQVRCLHPVIRYLAFRMRQDDRWLFWSRKRAIVICFLNEWMVTLR